MLTSLSLHYENTLMNQSNMESFSTTHTLLMEKVKWYMPNVKMLLYYKNIAPIGGG